MDWRYLVGEQLGPYRIETVLERGAYAIIYVGSDTSPLHTPVALKVLPRDLRDGTVIERFQHEIHIVQNLTHPNIMPVFEVGASQEVYWMAMALAQGGTLRQRLDAQHRLPAVLTAYLGLQMLQAVDMAHKRGIVHRDVKPPNLLFLDAESDHVYLGDFGIAYTAQFQHVTRTGTTVGTPEYMSPEQIKGQPLDGRSDIYSIGVVLYECLMGHPPFHGESHIATVTQHLQRAVPWPDRMPEGVNDALRLILLKALAKKPADRWQSAREMGVELLPWSQRYQQKGLSIHERPTLVFSPSQMP